MKVFEILLFFINLMTISSKHILQNSTSQLVNNDRLSKLEKNCPDLWKFIESISLTQCNTRKDKATSNGSISEEDVLEFACLLAQNMLMFICDNKLNITNEYLKAREDREICPFEFTQLLNLTHNSEVNLAEELKNEHCFKVCQDLYEARIQCVVLKKLNYFLKSYESQQRRVGVYLPNEAKPAETNSAMLRTDKVQDKPTSLKSYESQTKKIDSLNTPEKAKFLETSTSTLKIDNSAQQNMTKESLPKSKTETTSNKGTIASVKEQVTETKKSETENLVPEKSINSSPKTTEKLKEPKIDLEIQEGESKELKEKNDDVINSEDPMEEDIPELLSNPMSDDLSQLSVMQGNVMQEEEKGKVQMSFNRKEINSADGFFQAEDSHFFFYFIVVSSIVVIGYIAFHNKNKILAYALEGTSGRRSRRRPNPARYRKLETNLEEAISSNASDTVASSVVY